MDYNVLEVVLENWEETHNGSDLKKEKSFVSVLPNYINNIILEITVVFYLDGMRVVKKWNK